MKIILYIIIGLCFWGCNSKEKQSAAMLKSIIESQHYPANVADTLLNVENIAHNDTSTYFVYLLNSDCSLCLAQFFSFINILNVAEINKPVHVIINTGTKDMVDYYYSKIISCPLKTTIVYDENQHNKFYKSDIDINVGGKVFYMNSNKILRYFRVEEIELQI